MIQFVVALFEAQCSKFFFNDFDGLVMLRSHSDD